jgi:purine nucleoside phosphorylase
MREHTFHIFVVILIFFLCPIASPRLREKALSTAEKLKLKLFQGVYVSVCGPCYETPAEVQSGRALGTPPPTTHTTHARARTHTHTP